MTKRARESLHAAVRAVSWPITGRRGLSDWEGDAMTSLTSSYMVARFGADRIRGQRWAALLTALTLTICGAQPGTAATIPVTTTQQGVTAGQCSLQEAIYASELKANRAIGSTNPDTFYTTGCEPGTGDSDTIVLSPGVFMTCPGSSDHG